MNIGDARMRQMTESEIRRMFRDRGDTVKIIDTRVEFRRFGEGVWRFSGYMHDYVTSAECA